MQVCHSNWTLHHVNTAKSPMLFKVIAVTSKLHYFKAVFNRENHSSIGNHLHKAEIY